MVKTAGADGGRPAGNKDEDADTAEERVRARGGGRRAGRGRRAQARPQVGSAGSSRILRDVRE